LIGEKRKMAEDFELALAQAWAKTGLRQGGRSFSSDMRDRVYRLYRLRLRVGCNAAETRDL
jgi:hypothetical protein